MGFFRVLGSFMGGFLGFGGSFLLIPVKPISPNIAVLNSTSGRSHNSIVIPGKLEIASATRNPGFFKEFWMPVFTGMTVKAK